jgi:nucleoid-associated protein EbfC
MSGFNLQDLMSQAKRQYESLQKKMQETVVEGSAGGGTVLVKMDGRKQVLSIKIDPEALKAGDLEMLQDLITAAINGAGQKVDETMQSTMGGMLSGMGIPGV